MILFCINSASRVGEVVASWTLSGHTKIWYDADCIRRCATQGFFRLESERHRTKSAFLHMRGPVYQVSSELLPAHIEHTAFYAAGVTVTP